MSLNEALPQALTSLKGLFSDAFDIFYIISPSYWGPIVLILLFWSLYRKWKQMEYLSSLTWTLLEVKVPKELSKSPRAMEVVLGVFSQSWQGNWYTRFRKGIVRGWVSLEIGSIEGNIHFFIWTQTFFKKLIESQIYAQYPEVEIHEVDDYTQAIPYGKNPEWDIIGSEFTLEKEDVLPIKTYVDYELDKDVRDQKQQIDPLTQILELMGSIGKGEHFWLQILAMAAQKRFSKKGKWFKKGDWSEPAKGYVEGVIRGAKERSEGYALLTDNEKDTIKAVDRHISKPSFDCGMRGIYLAKRDHFDTLMIPSLAGSLKQYGSKTMNSFEPVRFTSVDYPWQDPFGNRVAQKKKRMFSAYRRRAYFYPPHARKPFVLSSEELATIFHFPGAMTETPTFERIHARKAEPPINLPTQ